MDSDYDRITISTVHKVQGITCDYAIVYLPLTDFHIEFYDNFFNVATSRASRGTLLVTYDHLDLNVGFSKEVTFFLRDCQDVSSEFLNELNKCSHSTKHTK